MISLIKSICGLLPFWLQATMALVGIIAGFILLSYIALKITIEVENMKNDK